MSNAQFRADFARLLKAAGDKAELVVRKTALELQSEMIARSPVASGRFKSNWTCGIGAANTSTSAAPGSDATGATAATLQGWKPGETIFLTNSLPYAKRLENGWSQQAPSGMVALTVQAYAQAVKAAVESTR